MTNVALKLHDSGHGSKDTGVKQTSNCMKERGYTYLTLAVVIHMSLYVASMTGSLI